MSPRGRTGCYPIRFLISKAQLRFLGHTARMSDRRISRYLLTWKPKHGNRSAGRQRRTLIQCLEEDLELFTRTIGMKIEDGINCQRAEKLTRMVEPIEEKIV